MRYKSGALNVVNIFVKSYELNGKKIVLFATSGGQRYRQDRG